MASKVVVVGSGLVGSLWAYMLKQRGYDVEVYEKRPDPKDLKVPAGRSINLVITSRGLRGLEVAGLLNQILPITVPVYGRCIHPKSGETLFQPYGRDQSECNYSISRWELNKALIAACLQAGVKMFFEHDLESIEVDQKQLDFKTARGPLQINYAHLFATDGAGSIIRKKLAEQHSGEYNAVIDWLDSDYKELQLAANPDGSPALEKNALHIWPRGTHMMMALANNDNSFTMTAYLPKINPPWNFSQIKSEGDVEKLFQSEFADAISLMPNYKKEFIAHPQGKLATVRLSKWVYQDSIAFLGDAAHAIVPFFGQGTNLGFEDCTTLLKLLDDANQDFKFAFEQYNIIQRPNANAIADMALENFVEMRDKVGDAQFQFKKKLESVIEKEFPQYYRSRYGLITYTLVPYHVAQAVGVKQSQLLERLAKNLKSPEDLDLILTKEILEKEFYPWAESLGVQTQSYQPKTN